VAAPAPPGDAVPSNYYANPAQTQFYAPLTAAAGPGHRRLPRNVLYGIIGAAVLVVAGVGGIIALAHPNSKPAAAAYTPPAIVTPTHPPATAPPQTAPPTPFPKPSPAASTPVPAPGQGTSRATFATVDPIPGFTTSQPSSTEIRLDSNSPSGDIRVEVISVGSGIVTNQDLSDALLHEAAQSSPDAARCQPDAQATLTTVSGKIPAVVLDICETYTPQNGQAFPAEKVYVSAMAHDAKGVPIAISVSLFSGANDFQDFANHIPKSWDPLFNVAP
jgi:hypothetical protein